MCASPWWRTASACARPCATSSASWRDQRRRKRFAADSGDRRLGEVQTFLPCFARFLGLTHFLVSLVEEFVPPFPVDRVVDDLRFTERHRVHPGSRRLI